MTTLSSRISHASRELKLFAAATIMLGVATSIIDSTLNNYLNERFFLTPFQRTFLELPRELPGFLVVFVSALLWFLSSRRLGVVAMVLGTAGVLLVGFASPTYAILVMCLFVYSMGQHLFMPVATTIGMELAAEGQTGKRLGQINALRNAATIAGSFLVFLLFKFLGATFQHTFALAALGLAITGALLFSMQPAMAQKPSGFLKLRKEYTLFYVLAVLYGSRKQLFITFAPWVIVTVFHQPTQVLATLMTIGGVVGILFQPLLGWMIDHLGERFVLAAEAVMLVVVCFTYGFARQLFTENVAFYVTCVCYLVDQMLVSVSMARSTYIKKIALQPGDVQPALSASISIDHIFSIAIAMMGGLVWDHFGYQNVFLMGVVIAVINFFCAIRVKIPAKKAEATI